MPYGSEWHLLRYLGRHRGRLHEEILRVTEGAVVSWLDFHFVQPPGKLYFDGPRLDAEWKGVDFLAADMRARIEWPEFWPQNGNQPNWDAVGFVRVKDQVDLLLVEAKAHLDELRSSCNAKEHGGRPQIIAALAAARTAFGAPDDRDWLGPYYQFCNRLAVLHFLMSRGVGARLLFVYFCGDNIPGHHCPATPEEWEQPLAEMYAHVGLDGNGPLATRVHRLFLPVAG
jgi:hypothetical protein